MFDTRGCNISQGHRSGWVKGTAARAMEKKGAMKWGQKGVTVTVPGQAVYTWSGGRRELQPFLSLPLGAVVSLLRTVRAVANYINPFRPALNCFNHCFYALTDEKQQIYKLTARHRVPRCELVDLLFLKEIVKMSASLWIF